MLRVLELFAGIGACSKALERLGIEHEIVDTVELDKYAIKSFNAIHGTNFEPQDIREWDKDIEVDLIMHGSPCQDFSRAGLNKGGDEGSGTRSSLMYESLRIIDKLQPKYVIWENVKNVISKKHKHNFDNYQIAMEKMGYTNFYQVLNSKDYGVPQNRERVFTVSIKKSIVDFRFPEPFTLKNRLKDILESEVDEHYYLSNEQVQRIKLSTYHNTQNRIQDGDISHTICVRDYKDPKCVKVGELKGKFESTNRVYSSNGISPTITTMSGGNQEPKIVAMRGRNPNNPSDRTVGIPTEQRLEVNNKGVSNTLTTVQKDNMVLEPDYRIRKLTPLECWRLMGFDDRDFYKAKAVGISNSQLYKQAGNSIVVNVLEAIIKNLVK